MNTDNRKEALKRLVSKNQPNDNTAATVEVIKAVINRIYENLGGKNGS